MSAIHFLWMTCYTQGGGLYIQPHFRFTGPDDIRMFITLSLN